MADDLVLKAKELAHKVHEGQNLYGVAGVSVMDHISEVARLVEEAGGKPEQIAAAWLHDTVEDTDVTLAQIRTEFGDHVADIVEGLTDAPELEDKPLAQRKRMQADHIKTEASETRLIKLADQIYHTKMAGTSHRSFDAKTCLEYIEGARLIANNCKRISPKLDQLYDEYYESSKKQLLSEIEAAK